MADTDRACSVIGEKYPANLVLQRRLPQFSILYPLISDRTNIGILCQVRATPRGTPQVTQSKVTAAPNIRIDNAKI